jgi:hypothetical protein
LCLLLLRGLWFGLVPYQAIKGLFGRCKPSFVGILHKLINNEVN